MLIGRRFIQPPARCVPLSVKCLIGCQMAMETSSSSSLFTGRLQRQLTTPLSDQSDAKWAVPFCLTFGHNVVER